MKQIFFFLFISLSLSTSVSAQSVFDILLYPDGSQPRFNEYVETEDHIEEMIASGKKIVIKIKNPNGIVFPANAYFAGEGCMLITLEPAKESRFLPKDHEIVFDSFEELWIDGEAAQLLRSKQGIDFFVSHWSSFKFIKKSCSPYYDISVR